MVKNDLLAALPSVLAEDISGHGISSAAADLLALREGEIERILIYPAIDRAEEGLLDQLADDLNVKWWHLARTLEEKRALMKQTWRIWRQIGTTGSVDGGMGAIYPGASAEEWYEYGGKPYHFNLHVPIPNTETDTTDYADITLMVRYFKNLRSVLDKAFFEATTPLDQELPVGGVMGRGYMTTDLPEISEPENVFRDTMRASAAMQDISVTLLPEIPILPPEYQRVEHLENIGDAYINTRFKPNQNTSAEVQFRYLESAGTGSGVFGARVSATGKAYTFILGSNGRFAFAYGSSGLNYPVYASQKDYVVKRDKRRVYLDGVLVGTDPSVTFSSDWNALLFTYNNNGSHFPAKRYRVYSCKIWDDGTIVRNLIPCFRKADAEPGMYDLVNNVFYAKSGSGTLVCGPETGWTPSINIKEI